MDSDDEVQQPRSKRLKVGNEDDKEPKLIVILENAQLETAKVGRNFELLSSDKHASFLKKHGKDPANYRPDIAHQCLLMLLDSPLNRAGRLRVWLHTARNVLVEISPSTRIPRTFDRFAGLMVQLLHKLSIRAADSSQKLLNVVKNPVSNHLPVGCRKLGTSFHATNTLDWRDLPPPVDAVGPAASTVIVVGAMAKGQVNVDYTEQTVKLSSYPLSAALACAKLCHVFEDHWAIK